MKNVMTRAWEIAKEGAATFGGKVKEYFQQALVMAWEEIKKGVNKMQIHKWKNDKGMEFELHAEHITEETRTTDWGTKLTKPANRVYIADFLVNGKRYKQGTYINRKKKNGVTVLDLGNVVFEGRKINMMVALPNDVNQAVWGEYDAIETAKKEKRKEAEKREEEEMKKKLANGYCLKCESYCYGDCGAN